MPTLTIKDWFDATNLSTINWRQQTLTDIIKTYNVRPGECVVFENVKQDKARVVANIDGLPVLLLPPIDPARQLSVYLEVNDFLRKSASRSLRTCLNEHYEELKERVARRQALLETIRLNRLNRTSKRQKQHQKTEA